MEIDGTHVENALNKSFKEGNGWPVYEHYKIVKEGGETFVVAPIGPVMEPVAERAIENGGRVTEYRFRDPIEDAKDIYAPLRCPELVVDLAYQADKPITPETVLRWAKHYGLLGLSNKSVIGEEGVEVQGGGRRDSVACFAKAADEVRTCLRAYEAVMIGEGPLDLEELGASLGPLPWDVVRPWGRHKSVERPWLFGVIARMVQRRLLEHCYPQLTTYTRGGNPSGRFALSLGFHNLLGAAWLQMARLLSAEEDSVRRCKLPDCRRVIHFEPSEPPPDPKLKDASGRFKAKVRGNYKTRSDIEFKDRGCKQKYHYRKKAGWSGYS